MKIITDEKILRKTCLPITKESPKELNKIVSGMVKTMIDTQGVGIASPQVGINKRLFLAVLDNKRIELFINPTITDRSEEMEEDIEGCLSVPDYHGTVSRHKEITIKYFNGKEKVTETYEGLNARIIQHEYDHLQGILYTNRAKDIHRNEEEKPA